jgi:hypothetical protein
VNQTESDRAPLAVFSELKRLLAMRESDAWDLDVSFGEDGEARLVTGKLVHYEGSVDSFGIRSQTDVRAIRLDPLRDLVFWREGTLTGVVDAQW